MNLKFIQDHIMKVSQAISSIARRYSHYGLGFCDPARALELRYEDVTWVMEPTDDNGVPRKEADRISVMHTGYDMVTAVGYVSLLAKESRINGLLDFVAAGKSLVLAAEPDMVHFLVLTLDQDNPLRSFMQPAGGLQSVELQFLPEETTLRRAAE